MEIHWFAFVGLTALLLYLMYSLFSWRKQAQERQQERQEASLRLQAERREEALRCQELTASQKRKRLEQIFDVFKLQVVREDNLTAAKKGEDEDIEGATSVVENEKDSPKQQIGTLLSEKCRDSECNHGDTHRAGEPRTVGDTEDESVQGSVNDIKSNLASTILISEGKREAGCCICLEPFESGQVVCSSKTIQCDHIFHKGCSLQWFQDHSDCPLCRTPLFPDPAASQEATGLTA